MIYGGSFTKRAISTPSWAKYPYEQEDKNDGLYFIFKGQESRIYGEHDRKEIIEEYRFDNNKNLLKVFGKRITTLKTASFRTCAWLEEVYFPNVVNMTQNVFNSCGRLKIVYLPKITHLPGYTFSPENHYQEVYLEQLIVPSCSSFNDSAFSRCRNLQLIVCKKGGRNSLIDALRVGDSRLPGPYLKIIEV